VAAALAAEYDFTDVDPPAAPAHLAGVWRSTRCTSHSPVSGLLEEDMARIVVRYCAY
jgi:hypothetical protein